MDELRAAMSAVEEIDPPKLDAFLDLVFAEPPSEIDFWSTLIQDLRAARYADLPELFRRMSAHLSAAGNSDLPQIYSSSVVFLRKEHPESFPDVLEATLALDPDTTPMESLVMLVDWADSLGRKDACDRLRQRFPEFPEYMLEEPEEEEKEVTSNFTDYEDDDDEEPEPEVSPEVNAALEKIWDDFQSLESASQEQAQAFIEELRWNRYEQTFVEIARDGWQTENRNPSIALIGLQMILRAGECHLNSPREKGEKYPLNLLEYLNTGSMERLILLECREFLGINRERSSIMCDAFLSLIHWSGRQGLLSEAEIAKAGKEMAELRKKGGF